MLEMVALFIFLMARMGLIIWKYIYHKKKRSMTIDSSGLTNKMISKTVSRS